MGKTLLPGVRYYVQTFTQVVKPSHDNAGLIQKQDPELEEQIQHWVNSTFNQIVQVGPLTISSHSGLVTRTLTVLYVPPVREPALAYSNGTINNEDNKDTAELLRQFSFSAKSNLPDGSAETAVDVEPVVNAGGAGSEPVATGPHEPGGSYSRWLIPEDEGDTDEDSIDEAG